MNVYVATKWENRSQALAVMKHMTDLGHVITYDWTQAEQETAEQAGHDLMGVFRADALIVLAEDDWNFRGTYVEMGIALTVDMPIYIVGPYAQTIFDKLPSVRRFPDYATFIQEFSR